jgi:hypothetical protein
MKKLFILATLGVLSLSSFKSLNSDVLPVKCTIKIYWHRGDTHYITSYTTTTESTAACNDIAALIEGNL